LWDGYWSTAVINSLRKGFDTLVNSNKGNPQQYVINTDNIPLFLIETGSKILQLYRNKTISNPTNPYSHASKNYQIWAIDQISNK
jgi:hypothetical protein